MKGILMREGKEIRTMQVHTSTDGNTELSNAFHMHINNFSLRASMYDDKHSNV